MRPLPTVKTLNHAWFQHVKMLEYCGEPVNPRDQPTLEVLDAHFSISDGRACLLDVPARDLNFRFAVAEWLWVASGSSDLESIAQYNSIIRQFSDDGLFLTGAYGPHVRAQRDRVLEQLRTDPNSRQAVIEIRRPQLYPTKDNPCTLTLQYIQRKGALHCIANMRSSDAWLGLPYDTFVFGMLQNCFAGALGYRVGELRFNLGSAHLYCRDLEKWGLVKQSNDWGTLTMPQLPGFPPDWLTWVMRDHDASQVPANAGVWGVFAGALLSSGSHDARAILARGRV